MVMSNAMLSGLVCVELIQLEERFDVVADEADRHDDQPTHTLSSQPLDLIFEIRLKPGQLSVARLEAQRPGMIQSLRYGLDSTLNVRRIRVAALDDLQRQRVRREEYVNRVSIFAALLFGLFNSFIHRPAQEMRVAFVVRPVDYLTHERIPVQSLKSRTSFLKPSAACRRREMRKER